MADYATLARPGRLGHFLPYLMGCRLRAAVWPPDAGTRVLYVFILLVILAYGAGLGLVLEDDSANMDTLRPKLVQGLHSVLLVSALMVDFMPTFRPVVRPLPEHYPVSARLNVVTAFLLDFITLRRLLLVVCLLTMLAVTPQYASVPGFGLLLVLGATVLSFNSRLLFTMGRWRHPLLAAHLASLGLMLWWLLHPRAAYSQQLGISMALLPWLLGAVQLYWLGSYFSVRYLPGVVVSAGGTALSLLPLEWKVYLRKAWLPLLLGIVLKTGLVMATSVLLTKTGELSSIAVFYCVFQPVVGFTYVNNNLFGFLGPLTANELQRLGLTPRLLQLYFRLVLPVVLVDCLLSASLLLALFPVSNWDLLGLLPLGAAACTSLGLWSSLYHAKPVKKLVDFANMRNNTSTLMNILVMAVAAALYFIPWWGLRIGLGALVTFSAWWPLQQVRRNDNSLRRRLWRDIGAPE